jgi:hypothetical protein
MISTSNSGGGQYLTITSCVGRGNWGSFCKGGKKKESTACLFTSWNEVIYSSDNKFLDDIRSVFPEGAPWHNGKACPTQPGGQRFKSWKQSLETGGRLRTSCPPQTPHWQSLMQWATLFFTKITFSNLVSLTIHYNSCSYFFFFHVQRMITVKYNPLSLRANNKTSIKGS